MINRRKLTYLFCILNSNILNADKSQVYKKETKTTITTIKTKTSDNNKTVAKVNNTAKKVVKTKFIKKNLSKKDEKILINLIVSWDNFSKKDMGKLTEERVANMYNLICEKVKDKYENVYKISKERAEKKRLIAEQKLREQKKEIELKKIQNTEKKLTTELKEVKETVKQEAKIINKIVKENKKKNNIIKEIVFAIVIGIGFGVASIMLPAVALPTSYSIAYGTYGFIITIVLINMISSLKNMLKLLLHSGTLAATVATLYFAGPKTKFFKETFNEDFDHKDEGEFFPQQKEIINYISEWF